MRPHLSDALLAAQTDERLVALTRAGHERAFAAIVERYRRPLVGFAGRIAPDSRAEDIVQQALTSAWAALAAGAEVAHLRGWLHQIVRHEAIRLAKQEGRAIVDPLEGEEVLARGAAAVEGGSGTAAGARRRGPWRRAGLTAATPATPPRWRLSASACATPSPASPTCPSRSARRSCRRRSPAAAAARWRRRWA